MHYETGWTHKLEVRGTNISAGAGERDHVTGILGSWRKPFEGGI